MYFDKRYGTIGDDYSINSQVIFDFNVSDFFDNGDKFLSWFIESTLWIVADFHLFEVWMTPLECGFILLIVDWGASVFLLYWLEDFNFSGSANLYGVLLGCFDISVALKFLNSLYWLTKLNADTLFFVCGLKSSDSGSFHLFVLKVSWFFLLDGAIGSWFSLLAYLLDLNADLWDILVDLSLAFSLCLEVSLVLSANSDTFWKVKWRHFYYLLIIFINLFIEWNRWYKSINQILEISRLLFPNDILTPN